MTYWRVNKGKLRRVLEEKNIRLKVKDKHKESQHRGAQAICYNQWKKFLGMC